MTPDKDNGNFPAGLALSSIETDEDRSASTPTRNITRRKKAAAAQRRLVAIVESSLDAIIGKGTDGVVISWNPAATDLFGWSSTEMIGRSIDVLIPPERRDEETRLLQKIAGGERIDPYETERLTKDGGTVEVVLSSSPIRDLSGQIEGVASVYTDIGWIKKREVMFQALLEAAHDAIVGIDAEGVIHVVNAQAEKLFGYDRGELIGRLVELLVPERTTNTTSKQRSSILAHRTTRPMGTGLKLTARHRDGTEFPVDIALSSLETSEGIIGVSVRDISDQIREAREKERLEQQLGRSRLESIGQLVGGIAHDFNNLLAGIMGFSKLVQEQLKEIADRDPDPAMDQVANDVEQIIRATERAASLTRELLLFGRQEVVQPQTLDLNAVVSGMEDLLRRAIGVQIGLVISPAPFLSAIYMDEGHLEQVLMNLVVNARDAMPSGGTISVRTGDKTLDDAYAAKHSVKPGNYVTLSVSDEGSGMPPEVIERAFEPYFSTKPRGEGSGLGLATVFGIVTQAGGDIAIRSKIGLGTTVDIHLPAAEGLTGAPAAAVKPAVGRAIGETILLVEDEQVVRQSAARFLRNAGYNVLVAGEASKAIALAGAHEGTIDLLLTDIVMPGMTGKELAENLLGSSTVSRVLYMSGYSKDVVAHNGALDPGVTLLEKPFTPEELLAGVRELIDSRPE
jgi:PAS domain S-box-containing protein